jgi:lysophospholipase L1-like esterase
MPRLLAVLAVLAGIILEPANSAPVRAAKKPVGAKKTTVRKKPVRRRVVPRPPVVSARVREASQEFVSGAMDAVAAAAVENSAALVPFFEQLHQLESQPEEARSLHVLQYGDSHTASDDWAHQLRTLFQGRFGNGGAGYSFAGRPFHGYRRYDVKTGQVGRWETEGLLTKGEDGYYGLGGVSIVADQAGQMAYLDADGEQIEIHYLKQPGGGAFRVTIDGVEAAIIETDGPRGPGAWRSPAAEGLRRYSVETLSDAPVKLFGWVSEKSRGLTWETLGINGAQASISLRWEEEQLREYLAKRNPGLLVLAYGTNEASAPDWNPASYRAMFRQVVQRFRALAPSASILVVGPPDRAQRVRRTWISVPKLDMIAEAQRAVALEAGCAFWDLRERMGGDGAMKRWVYAGFAQGDFVHLTGAGYRLVGETLYRDLMAHYEEFRKIRRRVFSEGGNENENGQAKENY